MADTTPSHHQPITLAFVGRAAPGGFDRAAAYEDAVLPLLVEHGGEIAFRGRQVGDDPALPAEVQILRVPSEEALAAFLADDRRLRLRAEHGDVFDESTVVRVEPVEVHAEADDDEIAAVVARLERAQQHEDVDAFVALFREDAVWTTGHGRRLIGRAEIEAFTRQVLPGAMASSTATYTVTHIVHIRPDVAAVQVRQQPVGLDGAPLPDVAEGRPMYVLSREREGWQIVAAQNTGVVEAS
jgi:uncharacterized protein (TIGR02246 family)